MDAIISDEQLITAFQSGDYDAFEKLYLRHKLPLIRFIYGFCHKQHIADEIFHDVWMKVIQSKSRYEIKSKFKTWIYQIARNQVIDYVKKKSTVSEVNNLNEEILNFEQELNEVADLSDELIKEEVEQTANQIINELPFEQKEVFLLKTEVEMTTKEIAGMLGENPETIKSRYRYAITKLKSGLDVNND